MQKCLLNFGVIYLRGMIKVFGAEKVIQTNQINPT